MPRKTAQQRRMDRVRILQRKAREKEYRLRKKGASGMKISSPRIRFSEVYWMSPENLKIYEKELKGFVGTRLTVLENGDVIEYKKLQKIKKNIKIHNEKAEKVRRRIQKNSKTTSIPKVLEDIKIEVKPKTAKEADSLLRKSEKWRDTSPSKVLRGHRKSAYSMLQAVGLDKEAAQIARMPSAVLEQLVEEGLLDDLALWYMGDTEQTQREIGYNADDFDLFQSRLKDRIRELYGR